MSSKSFVIKETDGFNFAKLSGDKNSIHLSKITGYNSIYGYSIPHGVLIILKFFEKNSFLKNFSYIHIRFNKGFRYNIPIQIEKTINKKLILSYKLSQENGGDASIEINFSQNELLFNNLKKITFKKEYTLSNKIIKKYKNKYIPTELKTALCYLSKYVGMIYPGKNSLISEIIIKNYNLPKSNKISFESYKKDSRFPNIENRLIYSNYNIIFYSLVRPELKNNYKKPTKEILKKIISIRENILIIGGSSGIGYDLLKLFLNNNKIKVIATYYKNKINIKKKNLIIKKLNIETDIKLVGEIIKKYTPILIYYFATPKIYLKSNNKKLINLYEKYYIDYPLKIINIANRFDCKLFYPSTSFIENDSLTPYSLVKLKAEKTIMHLKSLKTKITILRIPMINTRQNLSLLNRNLPNFRTLLFSNKEITKKVFFKD